MTVILYFFPTGIDEMRIDGQSFAASGLNIKSETDPDFDPRTQNAESFRDGDEGRYFKEEEYDEDEVKWVLKPDIFGAVHKLHNAKRKR